MFYAASKGLTEAVEFLIAEGAELGAALNGAAEGGYINLVKSLLERKAPLDWRCPNHDRDWGKVCLSVTSSP